MIEIPTLKEFAQKKLDEAKKFEINIEWWLLYFKDGKEEMVKGTEKEILERFHLSPRIDYRVGFISYLNNHIKKGHFQLYRKID